MYQPIDQVKTGIKLKMILSVPKDRSETLHLPGLRTS